METTDAKKLIALLETGVKANIELALELEKGLKIDLSNWWRELSELCRIFKGSEKIDSNKGLLEFVAKRVLKVKERIKVKTLSPKIALFRNLQRLDLTNHQIDELPTSFVQLEKLNYLNLAGESNLDWLKVFQILKSLPKLRTFIWIGGNQIYMPYLKNAYILNASKGGHQNWDSVCKLAASLPKVENLDLSKNKLKKLPESIALLADKTKSLNFSDNKLQELPACLEHFDKLVSLDLYGNPEIDWPKTFELLAKLPKFYRLGWLRASKKIIVAGFPLANNQPTKELNLSRCQKTNWNGVFEVLKTHFKGLYSLNIMDNNLEQLPRELSELVALKELFLGKNELVRLPEAFDNLGKLRLLDLQENPCLDLPQTTLVLEKLRNLRTLNLKACGIKALPSNFHRLNIQILHLDHNPGMDWIQTFEALGKMPNLNCLLLRGNDLKKIEPKIQEISGLELLDLRGNPDINWARAFSTFQKMPKLKRVNWLKKAVIEVHKTEGIQEIVLHKEWPQNWGNIIQFLASLPKLQKLILSANKINRFPKDLIGMKRLKHLDLSENELASLPKELGEKSQLEELNLHKNALREFPITICSMKELRYLDLGENNLDRIPEEIQNLKHLEQINLQGNPRLNWTQAFSLFEKMSKKLSVIWAPSQRMTLNEIRGTIKVKLIGKGEQRQALLAGWGSYARFLSMLPRLEQLDMGEASLDNCNWGKFAWSKGFSKLKKLQIGDLQIPIEALGEIRELLVEVTDPNYNRHGKRIHFAHLACQQTEIQQMLDGLGTHWSWGFYLGMLSFCTGVEQLELKLKDRKQLEFIATEVGFAQFSKLRQLSVAVERSSSRGYNAGKIIKAALSMPNLRFLRLRLGSIRELSTNIKGLVGLEELDLAENQMEQLPAGFGDLPNLQRLDLSKNEKLDWAQAIPKLAKLPNLKILSIKETAMRARDLQKLKQLLKITIID